MIHFLPPPLSSTYSSEHLVTVHTLPVFLFQGERPSFTRVVTTGEIIVLYLLVFIFLDSKWEDKRLWTER